MRKGQSILWICCMLCLCVHAETAHARVDHAIQKEFEEMFEEHAYYLREDLITYEQYEQEPVFTTTVSAFIYESIDNSIENVPFRKGEKVIINKVDFDAKTIEIDFCSLDSGKEGELIFDFRKRLSDTFSERAAFEKRFNEIFMEEALKKKPFFTDTINDYIEQGSIRVGMSSDDLLLTIGRPQEVFTRVRAEREEEWVYEIGEVSYSFFITNGKLTEWQRY